MSFIMTNFLPVFFFLLFIWNTEIVQVFHHVKSTTALWILKSGSPRGLFQSGEDLMRNPLNSLSGFLWIIKLIWKKLLIRAVLTSIFSFSSFSHHVASFMLSSVTRELTLSLRSLFSISRAVLSACSSTNCCCKASMNGWCPHSKSCPMKSKISETLYILSNKKHC